MPRYSSHLLTLAVGLLLAGCQDGSTGPTWDSSAPLQATTSRSTMVPLTWTYHMVAAAGGVLTCTNSDGSPPSLAFPINWAVASGMMTHLGLLDTEASSAAFSTCVVNIAPEGYPISASGDATVHLVGANGDAVDMAGVLTLSFADGSAAGDWTITGGTGRFTGAGGWIKTLEVPAADGNGSEGSGSGMITPPGILKR
jgi:hypothetical protein